MNDVKSLSHSKWGCKIHSIVMLEQIRTPDKRILERWVGTLRPETIGMIDLCLENSISFAKNILWR